MREFTHWYIIRNNFPYDFVAAEHDMLVPKRTFPALDDATDEELDEYKQILRTLEDEQHYESMQMNFSKDRSVMGHLHIHLIVWNKL